MLSSEDRKDVAASFGKKAASAVYKATKDGYDGNKRWGNSGVRGHGVNSPAMMEARKRFQSNPKAKALDKKAGKKSEGESIPYAHPDTVKYMRNEKKAQKIARQASKMPFVGYKN
jgi:uncharacterized protein YktA (UPF0223 family)